MAYISVTDAVEKTGRGQTTIYRLCRKYERTNFIKREDRKFLIDEEFLSRQYPDAATDESSEGSNNQDSGEPRRELVDLFIQELQNEKEYYRLLLDRKDEQLERKDNIIVKLQERQADLYHFLQHQTQLLEKVKHEEWKTIRDANLQATKSAEFEVKEAERPKDQVSGSEVRTIYTILAATGFLLLLALLFVDEIRAALIN